MFWSELTSTMFSGTYICYICLRTERRLKVIDQKLSSFHYKLCDLSTVNQNPLYCFECEHLLKKMYNFKNRCWKAMEILQSWIKTETTDKSPLTTLWTHIPGSLGYSQSTEITVGQVLSNDNTASNTIQDTPNNQGETNKIKFEITEDTDKVENVLLFKSEDIGFEEIVIENDDQVNNFVIHNDKLDTTSDHLTNDEVKEKYFEIDSESNDGDTLSTIIQNFKRTKDKDTEGKPKRKRSFEEIDDISVKRKSKDKLSIEKDGSGPQKKTKDIQKLERKENGNKRTRSTKGFDTKAANRKELRKPYSKERLIQELESKFSKCGKLVSSDGITINKEFILKCLHDKVTEYVMKQLYKAVHRKSHFKPFALKLFKSIQTKYENLYESVFDVEYLNTQEKVYEEFARRQTYECYIKAKFKCEVCFQGFKHEKMLTNHMKCHDKSTRDTECPVCKMRFKSRKVLISHQSAHAAVYKCKLCPLVTYYRSSMVNHYNWHKGMKYNCETCGATFGSISAQRTHMSYRHARAHVCARCGRAYNTVMGLRAHHTRYHANESPDIDGSTGVRCSKCTLTLASWDAYWTHQRYTHRQSLRGSPSTRRPSAIPRKRPVMTCRVCNAVGSSVGWLQLHFVEQHPAVDMHTLYADKHTHLCHICGKSFCSIYSLQDHQNTHTGERPYACDVCNARFHRSVSLRQHALVHKPASKPCPRCGKKFRTASNLNNHMRSHIGNRRYKCNICGKGFIHRNSVNEHVRGVHKNVRRVRKRGAQGVQGVEGVQGSDVGEKGDKNVMEANV